LFFGFFCLTPTWAVQEASKNCKCIQSTKGQKDPWENTWENTGSELEPEPESEFRKVFKGYLSNDDAHSKWRPLFCSTEINKKLFENNLDLNGYIDKNGIPDDFYIK
jgi:hypothetical protein